MEYAFRQAMTTSVTVGVSAQRTLVTDIQTDGQTDEFAVAIDDTLYSNLGIYSLLPLAFLVPSPALLIQLLLIFAL
jgi:hypothetical protein